MDMVPVPAFSTWNPFLAWALKDDAQPYEGFGRIVSEWHEFVGRRLKEDIALMQRLTQSRTPDQILAAYAEFWQKAAEDYGDEITTLAKLMSSATTKIVVAAQLDTDDAESLSGTGRSPVDAISRSSHGKVPLAASAQQKATRRGAHGDHDRRHPG